jgi:hypothetical protein
MVSPPLTRDDPGNMCLQRACSNVYPCLLIILLRRGVHCSTGQWRGTGFLALRAA